MICANILTGTIQPTWHEYTCPLSVSPENFNIYLYQTATSNICKPEFLRKTSHLNPHCAFVKSSTVKCKMTASLLDLHTFLSR